MLHHCIFPNMASKMRRLTYKEFKEFQRFLFGFCFGYIMVHWLSLSVLRIQIQNCRTLFRPLPTDATIRILTTEPEDKFLFIAVMTTRKYLETRAEAMYHTWGQRVPGKIVFFVGGATVYNGSLPVIYLNDIKEDTYPPQKKSFAMLKYVARNYINQYEWFMRADDDVFVKTDHLEKFLRSVNSSRPLYMGQSGTGTKEEKGKLGLLNDTPYCLGGPGVILTGQTLSMVVGHFSDCLNHTVTRHEDTELGRCIQKHVGIACTTSFEFTKLFYQNYGGKNGSFNHKLGMTEERAITLHPIKQHSHMYRLNNHFSIVKLEKLRKKLRRLTETLKHLNRTIDARRNLRKNRVKAKSPDVRKRLRDLESRFEITGKPLSGDWTGGQYDGAWDFVRANRYIYSIYSLFNNLVDDFSRRGKSLSRDAARKVIQTDPRYRSKTLAEFSYQRLSSSGRMENIILVKTSSHASLSVRTVQHLSSLEFTESFDKPTNRYGSSDHFPTPWIILPLYKRSKRFALFLSSLTRAVEGFDGNIVLCVVLYVDDDGEYKNSRRFTTVMQNFLNKLKIRLTIMNEAYSRVKAINAGIKKLAGNTFLIIMDVDMTFNDQFLNRAILNTKPGRQVYFPVYFSQRSSRVICFVNKTCDSEVVNFDNEYGTWRIFSYGIFSIYKEDALKLRVFSEKFKDSGKESVHFFEKCLKSPFHVFRAVDPNLMQAYQRRDCDPTLPSDQLQKCIKARSLLHKQDKDAFTISKELKLLD